MQIFDLVTRLLSGGSCKRAMNAQSSSKKHGEESDAMANSICCVGSNSVKLRNVRFCPIDYIGSRYRYGHGCDRIVDSERVHHVGELKHKCDAKNKFWNGRNVSFCICPAGKL